MRLTGLTIAFDLDGTLVDTAPDLVGALNRVLAEQGLDPLPLSSARWLVGRGARVLIERGFAAAGEPLEPAIADQLVARFLTIYRSRIAEESYAFEGLEPSLSSLHEAGAKLCVCTNKPTDLSILLLGELNLLQHFASVVGGDMPAKSKPDPGHFIMAVEKAGGDPSRAIMVGDSETDIATARAAGVPVVAVPFGYTELAPDALGADILIRRFSDLTAAVERLWAP
jgi:phosphoglycolate phosphatase